MTGLRHRRWSAARAGGPCGFRTIAVSSAVVGPWPSSKLMHSPKPLRAGRRRDAAVLRQSPLRRDHSPLFGAPGRRAARHDPTDYPVARQAAAAFYDRLRELFAERKSITTFGPYSPGQAVTMKRMGIEGSTSVGGRPPPRGRQARTRTRPRQLPAEPGARRGRRVGARAAHRRPQSAVPASADDRRPARATPPSTSARSSSPTPIPATAEIRTCAT